MKNIQRREDMHRDDKGAMMDKIADVGLMITVYPGTLCPSV